MTKPWQTSFGIATSWQSRPPTRGSESFYMEGMGFGLPALATTSGAAVETVQHGVNGFLIAPVDIAGLSQHITRLIQDRACWPKWTGGLNTYAAHPTWQQSTETIRRFLLKSAR